MSHVEKFAQKAAKAYISQSCGMLKPFKDPKFVEICVYEENDKTCLIAVRIEITQKSTGRRDTISGFQVWKSLFGAWFPESPGSKAYNAYLMSGDGTIYPNLYDCWVDTEYKRTITAI